MKAILCPLPFYVILFRSSACPEWHSVKCWMKSTGWFFEFCVVCHRFIILKHISLVFSFDSFPGNTRVDFILGLTYLWDCENAFLRVQIRPMLEDGCLLPVRPRLMPNQCDLRNSPLPPTVTSHACAEGPQPYTLRETFAAIRTPHLSPVRFSCPSPLCNLLLLSLFHCLHLVPSFHSLPSAQDPGTLRMEVQSDSKPPLPSSLFLGFIVSQWLLADA